MTDKLDNRCPCGNCDVCNCYLKHQRAEEVEEEVAGDYQ